MPTRQELIGADLAVEEIRAYVGADSLGYLSLDGMVEATGGGRGLLPRRASTASTRSPCPSTPASSCSRTSSSCRRVTGSRMSDAYRERRRRHRGRGQGRGVDRRAGRAGPPPRGRRGRRRVRGPVPHRRRQAAGRRHRRRRHEARDRAGDRPPGHRRASTWWRCAPTTSCAPAPSRSSSSTTSRWAASCPEQVAALVEGVAEGCRRAGCALLGGETAEHPGVMPDDQFDMAGFCVGVVDEAELLGPHRVREGDVLIGLASSGLHSNGYSLVRKALLGGYELGRAPRRSRSPARRRAARALRDLRAGRAGALRATDCVRAAAHITGGGFHENIPRALPGGPGCRDRPRRVAGAADLRARAAALGGDATTTCSPRSTWASGWCWSVDPAHAEEVLRRSGGRRVRASVPWWRAAACASAEAATYAELTAQG